MDITPWDTTAAATTTQSKPKGRSTSFKLSTLGNKIKVTLPKPVKLLTKDGSPLQISGRKQPTSSPALNRRMSLGRMSFKPSIPQQTLYSKKTGSANKTIRRSSIDHKTLLNKDLTMFEELRRYYDNLSEEFKKTNEYDKSLYTDKALLQRDALRFDNDVRETLMKLYTLTDENADGDIQREEYIHLNICLQRLVLGTVVDDEEALRVAVAEWNFDRDGHDHLNMNRLTMAFFQLADVFTDNISKSEYNNFLMKVYNSISKDVNGKRVFRDLNDIVPWKKKKNKRISRIETLAKAAKCISKRRASIDEDKKVKLDKTRIFLNEIMQRQNADGTWEMTRENCALLGILYDPNLADNVDSNHKMTKLALKEIKRVGKDILGRGKKHHARRASYQWSQNLLDAEKVMNSIDMKRRRERSLLRNSQQSEIDSGSQVVDDIGEEAEGEDDEENEEELSQIVHKLADMFDKGDVGITDHATHKTRKAHIVDDRGQYVRLSPTGERPSTFMNGVLRESNVANNMSNNSCLLINSLRSASSSTVQSIQNLNAIKRKHISPPLLPTKSFYEVRLSKKFTDSEFTGAKLLAAQRVKAKEARKLKRAFDGSNRNNAITATQSEMDSSAVHNYQNNTLASPPSSLQIEPADLLACIKHITRRTNAISSPKKSFYSVEETLDLHLGPHVHADREYSNNKMASVGALKIIGPPPTLNSNNIDKNVETMLQLKEKPKYFSGNSQLNLIYEGQNPSSIAMHHKTGDRTIGSPFLEHRSLLSPKPSLKNLKKSFKIMKSPISTHPLSSAETRDPNFIPQKKNNNMKNLVKQTKRPASATSLRPAYLISNHQNGLVKKKRRPATAGKQREMVDRNNQIARNFSKKYVYRPFVANGLPNEETEQRRQRPQSAPAKRDKKREAMRKKYLFMDDKLPFSGATNKQIKKKKNRRIHIKMKYVWPLTKNLGIGIKPWKPFYEE
jgi:hypothetical protein